MSTPPPNPPDPTPEQPGEGQGRQPEQPPIPPAYQPGNEPGQYPQYQSVQPGAYQQTSQSSPRKTNTALILGVALGAVVIIAVIAIVLAFTLGRSSWQRDLDKAAGGDKSAVPTEWHVAESKKEYEDPTEAEGPDVPIKLVPGSVSVVDSMKEFGDDVGPDTLQDDDYHYLRFEIEITNTGELPTLDLFNIQDAGHRVGGDDPPDDSEGDVPFAGIATGDGDPVTLGDDPIVDRSVIQKYHNFNKYLVSKGETQTAVVYEMYREDYKPSTISVAVDDSKPVDIDVSTAG